MDYTPQVISILRDVLVLEPSQVGGFDDSTALMGAIPEFDSMAVVSVITALEEEFDCIFDDDEITEENFATVGSLSRLVQGKLDS